MSTPAGGLIGDATINVNANTAAATAAINRLSRDANGRLRDMRGRFVSESNLINGAFNRAAGGGSAFNSALEKLKGSALSLAPALIPIAAQAAPIAAGVGAAAVAIGVFAAAAGGQVAALTEAGEAEKKYQDAMAEHGRTSKQAIDAQNAYVRSVKDMPPATREAAAALSSFKDEYKSWSDSLAGDTMPVATKAFATFGAVFPKLTPIVQGAGTQLNRFVTIAAGGVASPAFDRFMQSFAEFSTGALKRGNDMLIRFIRTLDTGKISGGFSTFMDYVRANGPLVRDTMAKLATALGNVMEAAASVGPGMLTVVNALAGLVAAVPPGLLTAMLQLALAMKAVRLAAVAMAATSGGIAAFGASIAAMRLAAGGAVGVLPRLGAAIATLSRTAKIAIAGTGIGLLLIAMSELSQIGQTTPPDVDRLTKSLEKLGHTGNATGYAAEQFGANFGKLRSEIDRVVDPSVVESINNWGADITGGFLNAGDDTEKFTESIGAIDKSLANLVAGGKASEAAAAIQVMTKGMNKEQLEKFNSGLVEQKEALADLKLEQQITAQAMGLFGQQAQQTSAKLAEQKQSADGLRQAIQALNDVNRGALGAQNTFEASIDALAEAAKKGAGALRYVKGEVDLNTEAARNADNALRATAQSTEEYAAAARESGAGWAKVNGIYAQGRTELLAQAQQFFRTKEEAQKYVDTILSVPQNKTAMLTADITDWKAKISEADKQLKTAKGEKKAKLTADIADWKAKVAAADLQLKGVKADKRAKLTADVADWRAKVAAAELQLRTAKGEKKATLKANIDDWRRKIGTAQLMINNLPASRSTTLTINRVTRFTTVNETSKVPIARRDYAAGGPIGFPGGGPIRGPGTATSDSIPIMASDGEYMINARSTAKYRSLIEAINADKLGAGRGMGGAGAAVAQGLAGGMTGSSGLVQAGARQMAAAVTAGVRAELQISSPSKVMEALAKEVGAGFVKGLTGTREQISRTAADIANSVITAFRGRKTRIDDRLVAMVKDANKRLQGLAAERDRIAQRIADARKFSADTAAQAKGAFSLQAVTQGPAGVSGDTIRRGLSAAAGQIREFIGRINVLRKRGLSKDLLAQIIGMGPEAGLEFANVLSRQSTESLREINRLQGQINKASTDLGKLSADALFDAGKQSGRGFLAGLAGQRKQIEQLMLSIAKSMQAAIRKALDINSPSGVMAEVGRQSTLGVAVGLIDQLPAVKKAMGGIARTISAGIAAPGLPVSVSAGSRSATAQQQPLNVTFINHGPIGSRRELDDWLVGSMDRLRLQRRLPKGA